MLHALLALFTQKVAAANTATRPTQSTTRFDMSQFKAILTTKATDKARLLRVAGREVWLPNSLVKSMTKMPPDASGEREVIVDAEDWWCDKNEL